MTAKVIGEATVLELLDAPSRLWGLMYAIRCYAREVAGISAQLWPDKDITVRGARPTAQYLEMDEDWMELPDWWTDAFIIANASTGQVYDTVFVSVSFLKWVREQNRGFARMRTHVWEQLVLNTTRREIERELMSEKTSITLI